MRTATFLLVLACAAGASSPASAAAENTFTEAERQAIDAFIEGCVFGHQSAIVVGLVDVDKHSVLAAGTLDNGTENAVDGDSIFPIGSVSKTFTALLLLDMARRGEVKLDDPVDKYLPDLVKVPSFAGKQVRLVDLATHTGALPFNPDNMVGRTDREQYETYTVERMEAFFTKYDLPYEPGTKYSYSNIGMALLGHTLARRADASFESLVVERICRPLGMHDIRITLSPDQRPRLAVGRDGNVPTTPWKFDAYQPAGDIHSTANDLLDYAAAHAGLTSPPLRPILDESHVIRFREDTSAAEVGPMGRTAMDWVDRNAVQPTGMQLLGHAGGSGSYHAWVGFDLKQRRGVVVLSTDNTISVEAIGWTILQRLPLTEERKLNFARQIVGIGAALALIRDKGGVRVDRVLPDSPAARAGLTQGLVIVEVDGETMSGKSLNECVKLIRGPAGSKVRLKVLQGEDVEPKTIELTRQPFAT